MVLPDMVTMNPELIFFIGSNLLEGPVWDPINKVIYCVSIEQSRIYRINYLTNDVRSYITKGHVGCVIVLEDAHKSTCCGVLG
jgi:sugar lactone lactonase YvrE